jgi:hypothetical protein
VVAVPKYKDATPLLYPLDGDKRESVSRADPYVVPLELPLKIIVSVPLFTVRFVVVMAVAVRLLKRI